MENVLYKNKIIKGMKKKQTWTFFRFKIAMKRFQTSASKNSAFGNRPPTKSCRSPRERRNKNEIERREGSEREKDSPPRIKWRRSRQNRGRGSVRENDRFIFTSTSGSRSRERDGGKQYRWRVFFLMMVERVFFYSCRRYACTGIIRKWFGLENFSMVWERELRKRRFWMITNTSFLCCWEKLFYRR